MTITLVVLFALIIFLFSVDASWSNVLSAQRNNLVFEGRNMQYGAYSMRKKEPKNLFIALIVTVGLIGGGCASWMFANASSTVLQQANIPVDILIDFLPPISKLETKIDQSEQQKTTPKKSEAFNNSVPLVVTEKPTINPASDLQLTNKKLGAVGDTDGDPFVEPMASYSGTGGEGKKPIAQFTFTDIPDVMPQFPGGDVALIRYMHNHVDYSEREITLGVAGTIYLSFVVNADGTISNVKTEKGIWNGERLAKEAEMALLAMPLWLPGLENGNPVAVRKRIPLKFILKN